MKVLTNIASKSFTKQLEKTVIAEGELMSTALVHLMLQERNIKSCLLPALHYMRIDKDGEPDYFYIEENLKENSGNVTQKA